MRQRDPSIGTIEGVLFDLDGTLLDTAADLVAAAHWALSMAGLPACPIDEVKPHISGGARSMLGYWLVKTLENRPVFNFPISNIVNKINEPLFDRLIEHMMERYEAHPARHTQFFAGMESVLDTLDEQQIPWGIVTNKLTRHTQPVIEALALQQRAQCIISGDTTPHAKPPPMPLLEASQRLGIDPKQCVYVGDSARDIEAGRRAGMATLAALYGYIAADDDVASWGADGALKAPTDLIHWIEGQDGL